MKRLIPDNPEEIKETLYLELNYDKQPILYVEKQYNQGILIDIPEIIFLSLNTQYNFGQIDCLLYHKELNYKERWKFSTELDTTFINKINWILSIIFIRFPTIKYLQLKDDNFSFQPSNINDYIPPFYFDLVLFGEPWYVKYLFASWTNYDMDSKYEQRIKYILYSTNVMNEIKQIELYKNYINSVFFLDNYDLFLKSNNLSEYFSSLVKKYEPEILYNGLKEWLLYFFTIIKPITIDISINFYIYPKYFINNSIENIQIKKLDHEPKYIINKQKTILAYRLTPNWYDKKS